MANQIALLERPDEQDLNQVRQRISQALGRDTIAALHRSRPGLDALAVFGSIGLFGLNLHLLASLPFGLTWVLLFVLQGFLLQSFGLVSHDLFVHRRIWGDRGSWLASLVLTLPRLSLPTGYEQAHLAHHRWIGTEQDTEAYKQQLDSRGKRWLFATLLGVKLAQAGKLKQGESLKGYHDVSGQGALIERRARIEKWLMRTGLLALLPLAWFFPAHTLLGYLLPTLVIGPVANSLRIIIEHAEADPGNPWHWSTCYRTGPLTRLLFFWDSGDCHVIHHIFPRLPFYHMGRAVELIRPLLLANGVVERRSYLELLRGWFVQGHPHRSLWPQKNRQGISSTSSAS
ncbi:MAG TPA: fatty acid desaturase [Pseudomonas sp.]|uniref:fatty acid desaturase family protein n=1 Tax=Pseudomonas sp. TaxID=306 RepID=UPI002B7358F6|nr:fatty acid desaturase [Pseudomonas sp.]HSX88711.1 fatty acid desaturase [Pseudomonas sp.]